MDGKLLQYILKNRYVLLLFSLLLILCVVPLLDGRTRLARVLQLVSLTLVFLAGVHANRARRRAYMTGIVISVVALPTLWLSLFSATSTHSMAGVVVVCCYCLVMAVLILISVFRDSQTAANAVLGAICSYLLIGLGWSFLYIAAVHSDASAIRVNTADEPAFLMPESPFANYVYFSFVTMSTLGYGDVSPITPLARTMAWLQSVAGQFYLAALVARLIGAIPPMREPKSPG